jgi:hypothetical protein
MEYRRPKEGQPSHVRLPARRGYRIARARHPRFLPDFRDHNGATGSEQRDALRSGPKQH